MASLLQDDYDKGTLTQIHTSEVAVEDLEAVMGRSLTGSEKALLTDFESSWKYFVYKKNETSDLPSGKREMHLEQLEEKVDELTKTRDSIESELMRQLAFFKDSQSALEEDLRDKIRREKQEYERKEKELKEQIEAIEEAQSLQEETLPWTFFLSRVDAQANAATMGGAPTSKARTVKPSQRAVYLAGKYCCNRETKDDLNGMVRRAFQIDHAILKAQIKMLHKQIQRYEKTITSQESAGLFLMENNVWSIME